MANFNFTVDTQEMAHTMSQVAPHVDGTTAAVVSMQTAVIIAERKASEKICDNVNRGFFGLIRSQISQKLAMYKSQIDAKLMELLYQSKELSSIKGRMERDFQMITSRYMKLFRSLDAALFTRVHELEKPLIEFARRDVQQLQNRAISLQAIIPIHQLESISTAQSMAISQTKASTTRAIGAVGGFIGEAKHQKTLVDSMLVSRAQVDESILHLPMAFVECDNSRNTQTQWHFFYPANNDSTTRKISAQVEQDLISNPGNIQWVTPSDDIKQRVTSRFNKLVDSTVMSQRAKLFTAKLFVASGWLVARRSQV